jgi:hypothetical protein
VSKADAQRAFREAKYARLKTPNEGTDTPPKPKSLKSQPSAAAPGKPPNAKKPSSTAEGTLCGHRNMGNKTCSRPAGHPEKNHRYK